MPSMLLEIQETVEKYADIMSKVAQVEVEVVDENLFRVAGTGFFSEHVNEDMSEEGYVYQHILRTGNREIVYYPGQETLCQNCPRKNRCQEEIEISMPIRLGGETIGVIGLVGSSREQRERILDNEEMYLELLDQIADFISVKAAEEAELKNRTSLLNTLDCVINHVERGILIFDRTDQISAANDAAKRQLAISEPEGKTVTIASTGDSLNHENEYRIDLDGKRFFIMGHLYDLEEDPRRYSRVLIFDRTQYVQERYYEMISMASRADFSHIIGKDPKTLLLQEEILRVAKSTSTVLITGESGTGKEMVARAIWTASDRKENRFVAINCGAIPEPLLESELFGYVKGAFTGADPNGRMGKFELANKGVIFLDEIGDMPLYLQVKLLRVIQERKLTRIGSNQMIPLDIRIIAATNKDLRKMIEKKQFREDLYYRLNVIPLRIAPLRERREDIRELAYHFLSHYAARFKRQIHIVTEDVMGLLMEYPWPGNVRELENSMEFMVNMMEDDGVLDRGTLSESIVEYSGQEAGQASGEKPSRTVTRLRDLERQEIEKALELFGSDTQGKKKAAGELGISLATLYRKLENISHNKK